MIQIRLYLFLDTMPCSWFSGTRSTCTFSFQHHPRLALWSYSYGGIYERGARVYTLDDFHSLQLDKLDKFICLKENEVVPAEGENDESEDDDEDDDEGEDDGSEDDDAREETKMDEKDGSDDSDEVVVEASKAVDPDGMEKHESRNSKVSSTAAAPCVLSLIYAQSHDVRRQAEAFLQQAKSLPSNLNEKTASPDLNDDSHVTPLPGDTLAIFYARTKDHWARKAFQLQEASQGRPEARGTENRAKLLRRDGFALAEERWTQYKPILEEVQKILEEAGEDASVSTGRAPSGAGPSESRNRR